MANKKLPAENQTLKNVIYILIQCSWGLPQTLLGFIVLLINIKNKHYFKTLNKSDLSAETLEWLEWFNGLSETGQLSVSFVPQEILELCGYVSTENSEVSGPTD